MVPEQDEILSQSSKQSPEKISDIKDLQRQIDSLEHTKKENELTIKKLQLFKTDFEASKEDNKLKNKYVESLQSESKKNQSEIQKLKSKL